MATIWREQWLPEIRTHLDHWDAWDLSSAPVADLVAHLDDTRERVGRLWTIHFEITGVCYPAMRSFHELYVELFAEATEMDAVAALQGLSNLTVESAHTLWDISRHAAAVPDVARALDREGTDDLWPALEAMPAAADLVRELRTYLDRYGRRGEFWNLTSTPLIEDP